MICIEPWVIEDLERSEREQADRVREQPQLEIPMYPPENEKRPEVESGRGVIVIQIWGD